MKHLQVVFNQDAVYVLFTIYEKSSVYGNVDLPAEDEVLSGLLNLVKFFNSYLKN